MRCEWPERVYKRGVSGIGINGAFAADDQHWHELARVDGVCSTNGTINRNIIDQSVCWAAVISTGLYKQSAVGDCGYESHVGIWIRFWQRGSGFIPCAVSILGLMSQHAVAVDDVTLLLCVRTAFECVWFVADKWT